MDTTHPTLYHHWLSVFCKYTRFDRLGLRTHSHANLDNRC